jgi:hypothetical protein
MERTAGRGNYFVSKYDDKRGEGNGSQNWSRANTSYATNDIYRFKISSSVYVLNCVSALKEVCSDMSWHFALECL